MRFYSKKDWWIAAIIWIPTSLAFIDNGRRFITEEANGITLLIFSFVIGFLGWIWFGTYYDIKEEFLYVACGPFKQKIPYQEIKSMKETRNPLSSSAMSLDRIEIRYKKGLVLISPNDKEIFIKEMALRGIETKRK